VADSTSAVAPTARALPAPSNQKALKVRPQTAIPIPNVHYAPLHIKGITTTAPVDGNARKQKRLEEVRKKRVEVKERKRREREEEIRRWEKGLGKGTGKLGEKGRIDQSKEAKRTGKGDGKRTGKGDGKRTGTGAARDEDQSERRADKRGEDVMV